MSKKAPPAGGEEEFDVVIEGDTPPAPAASEDEADDDEVHEESEEGDEPASDAADEPVDDDSLVDDATREKRERRRLERHSKRQAAREKEERMRSRLEQQERLIVEQTERLAALERKDVSHDLSQLDQRITNAAARAQQAEHALQKAIATGDGELHTQAMKVWYESSREAESLSNYKQNLVKAAQQPAPVRTDPLVKSMAEQWAARNSWYDPGNRDADSKVAYALSEAVAQEGLSPNDAAYWRELDARVARYLPHRLEQTDRQSKPKPRAPVAGSGRDSRSSSGREEFVLSRERVEAIKQAGAWDDPAARKQMIAAYRDYDRTHSK
jgi:hypothetical protein